MSAKKKPSDWVVKDYAGLDTPQGWKAYGDAVSLTDEQSAEILAVIPGSIEPKEASNGN